MKSYKSTTYALKSLLIFIAFISMMLGWYVDHRNCHRNLDDEGSFNILIFSNANTITKTIRMNIGMLD